MVFDCELLRSDAQNMFMLRRRAIILHGLDNSRQCVLLASYLLASLFAIVMQHPHTTARALTWRLLLRLVLLRARSDGVAASDVSKQHCTCTLAKTPDPSSLRMHRKSCSGLLLPLLPALVAAPSALFPLAALLLVVASKRVAAAESKCCGRQTVRKVDLGADRVGKVGDDEDVLDVCVARSR